MDTLSVSSRHLREQPTEMSLEDEYIFRPLSH